MAVRTVLGFLQRRVRRDDAADGRSGARRFSTLLMLDAAGHWSANGGVQTSKTKESVAEFDKEMKDLAGAKPITEAEFDTAKVRRLRGYAQQFESLDRIAGQVGTLWALGLPMAELQREYDAIGGATLQQALAVSKKYALPSQASLLLVGDRTKIEQGVRDLGLGEIVVTRQDVTDSGKLRGRRRTPNQHHNSTTRGGAMAEVPTRGSNPLRGLAALAVLVLTGQTLAMVPQQRQTGIFVEDPGQSGAEALSRLESTMMQPDTQGTMGAAMTGGLGGVETAGMLEGERAARRVEPGVSFQFHFEEKSKRMPKMPTNLDEALENTWDTSSLPPTANAPKEFGLIKLEVKEGNRRASLGKAGGLMGGRGKPKGLVECVVEEIAPNTYRVKPKAPLAPGEYAFVYLDQGGGFVWDFGVGDR